MAQRGRREEPGTRRQRAEGVGRRGEGGGGSEEAQGEGGSQGGRAPTPQREAAHHVLGVPGKDLEL